MYGWGQIHGSYTEIGWSQSQKPLLNKVERKWKQNLCSYRNDGHCTLFQMHRIMALIYIYAIKKYKKYKDTILNYNGKGKKIVLDFLVSQWLRICAPKVGGAGSVPGWGWSNMLHGTARNLKKIFLILFWLYEIFCSCVHNVTSNWKRLVRGPKALTVRVSRSGHRYITGYRIVVFSYIMWDRCWLC